MDIINNFIFKDDFEFNDIQSFYARIHPYINSKIELLYALYFSLWLPNGFGMNWDALYDSLSTLELIKEKNVFIVHENIPNISENDLNIYIETLCDSILIINRDINLNIIFKIKDKNKILNIVYTWKSNKICNSIV